MDKVIIITGATSGFGKATALTCAKEGAKLILVARRVDALKQVEKEAIEAGGEAVIVAGDVQDESTFQQALHEAMTRFGRVDVLINNAGGGVKIAPIEEMDNKTINDCLQLNLSSTIIGCREIAPQMKKQGSGLIINLASACSKFAWPNWSVYSAAKAGVSMFSRCLQAELRPDGIGVSVIVPGASNTEFLQRAKLDNFEWDEENALQPKHIAAAALSIIEMDKGAMVPEVVVYGMEQEIIPF